MKSNNKDERTLNFRSSFQHLAHSAELSGDILQYAETFSKRLKGTKNITVLKEQAYQHETQWRMLNAQLLDHVNSLYDSGRMDVIMKRLGEAAEKNQIDFMKPLQQAKEHFHKNQRDVDVSFLDYAIDLVEQRKFKIQKVKDYLVIQCLDHEGKTVKTSMATTRLPGSIGRISKADLYGTGKIKLDVPVNILFDDENCHHRNYRTYVEEDHSHDIYEKLVTNMVFTNESAYRHARVLDEYGVPHLRGNEPITIIIAVLAIVAAALIIAGAVIEIGCAAGAWSGDVCDVGWWLIGLGVVFAVGAVTCYFDGCTLAIVLFTTIAA